MKRKYQCDIKNCNKTATNFYYKGFVMGYYREDLSKGDVCRGKKSEWLKLCDDCNIHKEYVDLIRMVEKSRKETDKLIKKAKELFNL